jgi:Cytochrome oxidase complex assembly protein 1
MDNNTSGQGKNAEVPAEIRHWNWGAFFLNWIWGIGNATPIALLALIPGVGFVMMFVLGAKGSEWAWRNRRWNSVEDFRAAQRIWAICGALVAALVVVMCIGFGLMIGGIFYGMKQTDAYKLGVATVQASSAAAQALGPPLETGWPNGSIKINGPGGSAELEFSVSGQKAKGTVYFEAVRQMGQWQVKRAELEVEGSKERIDLAPDSPQAPGPRSVSPAGSV